MLEKSIINKYLKTLFEQNRLDKSFYPIIEEYFYRVSEQQNWTEQDLSLAINRFDRVMSIKFMNINFGRNNSL